MCDEQSYNKSAEKTIIQFLKANVPRSDVPNVEAELKKDFVLAKRRSKGLKTKKPLKRTRTLTKKEKKTLGFYSIPRDSIKYDDVLAMNTISTEYLSQILELDRPVPECTSKQWESFTQTLYKADFHGVKLQVSRSKCPSYVGKVGICVMDTKNTFKIVSEDNKLTTIPKKDSVFILLLNNIRITLFGKHLCARPAERSTKKIKSYLHPDL